MTAHPEDAGALPVRGQPKSCPFFRRNSKYLRLFKTFELEGKPLECRFTFFHFSEDADVLAVKRLEPSNPIVQREAEVVLTTKPVGIRVIVHSCSPV